MNRLMRGIVLFTQRFFQDENKRLHMKKSMMQSREDQIMKKKSTVYQLTTCALMAALMCILGPNSIPIGPVPVSLTNLVIYLAVYLLGTKGSTISYIVYLFLGMVGLPVFSGYEGGFGKLAGPTGGYLIGFILMAIVCGIFMEKSHANVWITSLGMVLGTIVAYLFGTVWFIHQLDYTWGQALAVCVWPFIPFDLIKIVIAGILGKSIRHALSKAHLLPTEFADKKAVETATTEAE